MTLRGYGPLPSIPIEAYLDLDLIEDILRKFMPKNSATIIMTSTPRGSKGFFYDMLKSTALKVTDE